MKYMLNKFGWSIDLIFVVRQSIDLLLDFHFSISFIHLVKPKLSSKKINWNKEINQPKMNNFVHIVFFRFGVGLKLVIFHLFTFEPKLLSVTIYTPFLMLKNFIFFPHFRLCLINLNTSSYCRHRLMNITIH